jgi:hypothetical protein
MKITALAAMIVVAGGGASAARLSAPKLNDAMETVQVCAENSGDNLANFRARSITKQMFAGIGVLIEWRQADSCPAGALRISYSTETSPNLMPGALAYAYPYEGTHIVVFYDRVRATVIDPEESLVLLAHVMTHEITHILEGTARHSAEGVMKAHWTPADYSRMCRKPLPFAAEDVELIHRGLQQKAAHRTAGLSAIALSADGK